MTPLGGLAEAGGRMTSPSLGLSSLIVASPPKPLRYVLDSRLLFFPKFVPCALPDDGGASKLCVAIELLLKLARLLSLMFVIPPRPPFEDFFRANPKRPRKRSAVNGRASPDGGVYNICRRVFYEQIMIS